MTRIKETLKKLNTSEICFVVFLFLAVLYMCYICYCDTISGDEYFSVGFANNAEGFLFLTGSTLDKYSEQGWIDGTFLRDYLSVQKGDEFAIMQIHRNVRDDVHPPLYFMLLNVLSSFFIDEIPYLAGFLINVVSGILICVFLYLISRKTFRNPWIAMAAPILWLGTEAARLTITYLRMYAPLSALCLICVYLHICFFEKEKVSKWLYVALAVCTMIGTLTHYYFYIMVGVIGLISAIRLLYQKQIKRFAVYAMSHAGGWVISYMAYPYVFEHVLFSGRGISSQAEEKVGGLSYYIHFAVQFLKTINESVFNNSFKWFLLVFLLLGAVAVLRYVLKRKNGIETVTESVFVNKSAKANMGLICGYALGYLMVLFKISYSAKWLYLSPTFALIIFCAVGLYAWMLDKIDINNKYIFGVLGCVFLTGISITIKAEDAHETNVYRTERHEAITTYNDSCDAIFFYTKWNNLYNNQIQELMEFDQIYSIDIAEIETADYTTILNSRRQNRDLIVYIPTETEGYEQKTQSLAQTIGTGELTAIVEDVFAVYYIDVE